MADPEVMREAKDILQKRLFGVLGDGLVQRFGLGLAPIVGQLPADLPVLEVRAQYADLLHLLADDTLLDLELQSSYEAEDLLRFGDYNWAAFRRHRKRTQTVVLYGPAVTSEPPTVVEAGGHTFRVINILLSRQDGDATSRRLQEKVARGEPLDAVDRVDLALTALLPHKRPLVEVVAEILPVVRALPATEHAETVGTIIGLGYHYLEESVAVALLEAFKMANPLVEVLAEGLVQGRVEGVLEGKHEAILDVLSARFGELPVPLQQRVARVSDLAHLKRLVTTAATVTSLAEFASALDTVEATP